VVSDHSSDGNVVSTEDEEEVEANQGNEEEEQLITCPCGCCRNVYGGVLDYCCHEATVLTNYRGNLTCILEVDEVLETIGSKTVLWLFSQKRPRNLSNKEYRHSAYKICVKLFGYWRGGVDTRYRLPSCVVAKIRDLYPSPNGSYTGFDIGHGAYYTYIS
jgi:hypothetical protein